MTFLGICNFSKVDSTFSKLYSLKIRRYVNSFLLQKCGEAKAVRHSRRSLRLDLTEIYGSLMNPQVI